MEIVLEAPRGKVISKSWWGKDKKRVIFFLISLWGAKREGQLTYSILSGGKKYAGRYGYNPPDSRGAADLKWCISWGLSFFEIFFGGLSFRGV